MPFEAMPAMAGTNFMLTGSGEPKLVPGERVTRRFFDLFGMPALHGRALHEADRPGGTLQDASARTETCG